MLSKKSKIEIDVNKLLEKVEHLKKKGGVDLSSDEDLSIALMNLIAIEEHLYFSAMKTGKKEYLEILNSVREMRKKLLKEIVKDPKGEEWCISKHLLASSMRLIEVGTKHLAKKEEGKAAEMFKSAFELYSLFWSINLKLIKSEQIKSNPGNSLRARLAQIVKKIIDCCKE